VTALKTFVIAGVVAYLAILAFMYFSQRRLMFVPDASRIAPAAVGFGRAQARELRTPDGESVILWTVAPAPGKPAILYFHGNAGQIAGRADRFARLTADGTGLIALSYRGYGGSSGSPSESGLMIDGRAAYDFALQSGIPPERIILFGESLGTGIAVALAAQVRAAAVILEAPFSSAAAVAASIYWMFPVRWLMRDQFRSDTRIVKIGAPLLIVHGTSDGVVPLRFGEQLFAAAVEPKAFLRVAGAGHQPLDEGNVLEQVRSWLARHLSPAG